MLFSGCEIYKLAARHVQREGGVFGPLDYENFSKKIVY